MAGAGDALAAWSFSRCGPVLGRPASSRAGVLTEVLNISNLVALPTMSYLSHVPGWVGQPPPPPPTRHTLHRVSLMGSLLHVSTADTPQPCRWRRRGRTLRVPVHSLESHETGFVTALPNADFL